MKSDGDTAGTGNDPQSGRTHEPVRRSDQANKAGRPDKQGCHCRQESSLPEENSAENKTALPQFQGKTGRGLVCARAVLTRSASSKESLC